MTSFFKSLKAIVLASPFLFSLGATAQSQPPAPDYDKPRLNLPPKLTIPEDANYILFDGKKLIKEESNYIEALQRFTINKREIVLVRVDSGEKSCPSKFFFVVVDNGAAEKTPEFGTCSHEIQVSKTKTKITVDNAEFKPNNRTKYVFEGDSVKETVKK